MNNKQKALIDLKEQRWYTIAMQHIIIEVNKLTYKDKVKSDYKRDVIIVSTPFDVHSIDHPFKFKSIYENQIDYINDLLFMLSQQLNEGGKLFVYGLPKWLSYYAKFLSDNTEMEFKYWFAVDGYCESKNELRNEHIGILFFTKPGPFILNTATVRVPYVACRECGRNTKDWGGKKHQMNKLGSGLSDVWKDVFEVDNYVQDKDIQGLELQKLSDKRKFVIKDNIIPQVLLERIIELSKTENSIIEHYICTEIQEETLKEVLINDVAVDFDGKDSLYLGDCIEIMDKWIVKYPNGCFDLIFADPPYNLDKDYDNYSDQESDSKYIKWCEEWITRCAKLLKPNGALLVLNLPKWAYRHAVLLNQNLYMQNWIVWDALSTPKGKIMPAHYALLYYTKQPEHKVNKGSLATTDSIQVCSRQKCKNIRENSITVGDIWSDIHRIKHKKDRDDHPCQLPQKLMERIIGAFSDEGNLVFDPFSGAGTTAIVAKKMNRHYAGIDISEDYIKIAEKRLHEIETLGDEYRESKKVEKNKVTKKKIELTLQDLARRIKSKPTEEDISKYLIDNGIDFTIDDIVEVYGDLKKALKCTRLILKDIKEGK